jgi:hypothetical protein
VAWRTFARQAQALLLLRDLLTGRDNGTTGSTTRPKVELSTTANDAYQAATAVTIPAQPPAWMTLLELPALPIASRKNVIARSANTSATAPVVRSEATNMYVVKIAHAYR